MAIVGGTIGGLIGAGIWAGITYGTNHEIGWIAWGVGFLVGAGVRLGSQEWDGVIPGSLAVILSVLSVVGGKYAAASLIVSKIGAGHVINVTADDLQESICYELVEERAKNGPLLKWAPGKNAESAETLADFPADIQDAAKKRWAGYSPAEQQQKIAERKEQIESVRKMMQGVMHNVAFQSSFGVMDILFFLLAAYTAFRLGSGAAAEED